MIPTSEGAARRWLAEYVEHLELGCARLRGGEPLTPAFADRCQELDDTIRQLGGDALRACARAEGGGDLIAGLQRASARFEAALRGAMTRAEEQLADASKSRQGLHGYAVTGQWLKATGGRFIERTG